MKVKAIDANVILRFLLADHPQQSPRCQELITRVQNGREAVFVPEVVVNDVVWTLKSFYHWPPDRIGKFMESLLSLDGVQMLRKVVVLQALRLFANLRIDYSDALIVAEMLQTGREDIYSYDRDFDRVSGLQRVEP